MSQTADERADIAIGWFGKIPAVGDFVGRRLPEVFRRPWDHWLQQSLAQGKARLGEHWDTLYLTFPAWRFLVPAGLFGERGWSGLLLPSVDCVGRCYPLTFAESWAAVQLADHHPPLPVPSQRILALIERRLAVLGSVIDPVLDGAGIDALERMLAGLIVPPLLSGIDDQQAEAPTGVETLPSAPPLSFEIDDHASSAPDSAPVVFWQCPEPGRPINCRSRPLSPASFIELVLAE